MKGIEWVIGGLRQIDGGMGDGESLPPDVVDPGFHPVIWQPDSGESRTNDPAPGEQDYKVPRADVSSVVEISPQVDWPWATDLAGSKSGKEIKKKAVIHGTDAYAWYISFRHRDWAQWGIHIPTVGLVTFAREVFHGQSGNISIDEALKLSFMALLHHEEYHFRIDYAIAQCELLYGEACYLPARRRLQNQHGYIPEEEALANAAALRSFQRRPKSLKNGIPGSPLLRRFIEGQGEGYRDGGKFVSKDSGMLQFETHALIERHLETLSSPGIDRLRARGIDGYGLLPHRDSWQEPWQYCPVVLVDDAPSSSPPNAISFIAQISEIQETKKFIRQLQGLPDPIKRKWKGAKEKLRLSTQSGNLRFRKWPPDETPQFPNVYSVNLDDSYRAHIGQHRDTRDWWGIRIGGHKATGHG